MLARTTNSLRVAVLGSGIAGSSAARSLADRGVEVTVFESGFGVGGRTSTRVTRDGARYQFDHGAQYIGAPETDDFRRCLEGWKSGGFVKEWPGTFATVGGDGAGVEEGKAKERWVGYPRMSSICDNLLHHPNIAVRLQTRAHAFRHEAGSGWHLRHGKTKDDLGSFDWLVATDRNSAAPRRKDLSSAGVDEFATASRNVRSVKSLTAMVAFEESLRLKADGMKFECGDAHYGALGWAARDTSKPGRERGDGRECWVLQSNPDSARDLLKGRYKIDEIRKMAREVLVDDFLKSIPYLPGGDAYEAAEVPAIAYAIGHRWGAAFPLTPREFSDRDCQVIPSKRFAACGDYFGRFCGRIEGAYLSGMSAASEILKIEDLTQ